MYVLVPASSGACPVPAFCLALLRVASMRLLCCILGQTSPRRVQPSSRFVRCAAWVFSLPLDPLSLGLPLLQDVPITQLHKPFISVERPAADAPRKWANHPLTRLAVGAAVAGLLYVLYSHAPDKGERQTSAAGGPRSLVVWPALSCRHVCWNSAACGVSSCCPRHPSAIAAKDLAMGCLAGSLLPAPLRNRCCQLPLCTLPHCPTPATLRPLPAAACCLPAAASITTEATRYRDEVMDWLGLQREGQQRLGNGTAAGNATVADAGDSAAGGGADAGGAGDAAAGSAAEAAGDGTADPDAAEL